MSKILESIDRSSTTSTSTPSSSMSTSSSSSEIQSSTTKDENGSDGGFLTLGFMQFLIPILLLGVTCSLQEDWGICKITSSIQESKG